MFCPICESIYKENDGDVSNKQEPSKGDSMIKCNECYALVHVECERMFQDERLKL